MEVATKDWGIGGGEAEMTTKFEEPLTAQQTTQVADMPPLDVVTEGIPPKEHVESAPVARGWRRAWAWALAGVMGLLLVVAGVLAVMQYSSTGEAEPTVVPPAGSDVVEPPSESVYSGPLEGPELPDIQAISIPTIPSIAEISIAPVADITIPDMTVPEISIAEITFPDFTVPDVTIPDFTIAEFTIPDVTIPEIVIPEITIAEVPGL